MENNKRETISQSAARTLRGGMPHVPPPATPVATRVRLELEAGPEANPEIIFADPDREDTWRAVMSPGTEPGVWTAEILTPQEPTILYYHFELADGTVIRERRQKDGVEKVMLRARGTAPNMARFSRAQEREVLVVRPVYGAWKDEEFRIAVYLPDGAPPDWVLGQVFYQIFPDRFARGAETPRIEHTYQRESLYLPWGAPPEHPPKGRDFYGGNLRGVIDKLDYLSSLGVTCIYFTPIFASPTNHRYDTLDYHLIDPQLGTVEDLIELIEQAGQRGMRILLDGVFNHCSSESIYFKAAQADPQSPYYRWFHFNHWPDDYLGWAGVQTMPEFVECPEVEDFFFGRQAEAPGIAQYWLSFGTAGWRTDVTPWLSDAYWKRFRRAVRQQFPQAFLVAEDWGNASKRLLGDRFDATMNYRFTNAVIGFAGGKLNPLELDDRLETLRRDTPPGPFQVQLNLLDSHDTPRALTRLKGNRQRLILAAALQMAYPGAPMVYSGDEAGQEGAYAEDSRRAFPWDHPNPLLLDFYTRAIHLRRASRALSFGGLETVWIDARGGYAFLRREGGEMALAVFNNGRKPVQAEIPIAGAANGPWEDKLGYLPPAAVESEVLRVKIPALTAGWYMPAGE